MGFGWFPNTVFGACSSNNAIFSVILAARTKEIELKAEKTWKNLRKLKN